MAFTTLLIGNLALILTNLSWTRSLAATIRLPNRPLWWVLGGVLLFIGLMLYIPFLTRLLSFAHLHALMILGCVAAGLLGVVWFEGVKWVRERREKTQAALIT